MENSIMLIVLAGLLAGTIHVLSGPDHLAAIAPFTANQPKKSWQIGMWWGFGHTTSVWIIAILVFILKAFIPLNGLSQWGERIVGVVLIGLGIWGIQKAFSKGMHFHVHQHNGATHAHYHLHNAQTAHHLNEARPHRHKHAPMGIGIIHGFGGSAHLIAIIPALALPGQFTAAGYVIGFGVGTIMAMICFSWIIGLLQQRVIYRFAQGYKWMQLSFSIVAIGVGVFWLVVNM